MNGFYFCGDTEKNETEGILSKNINLLCKNTDMEIMSQKIVAGANVWLSPAKSSGSMEFFFVHSGAIAVTVDGKERILRSGESFYINRLEKDMPIRIIEDTLVLYVSNTPVFEETHDFEKYINVLISQINAKDQYTYQHSANVMRYATRLYEKLNQDSSAGDAVLNDMLVAALFHDVGKCYTPDAILKKKSKLTPDEMRYIHHHPIDSARLLRKHYSERVAEIAEHHHERMDGSGYPFGLRGEEISAEARIVAVADAFDAMTTNRGYNRMKSFTEAAEELVSLPDKFDSVVTTALYEMEKDGSLSKGDSKR